MTPTDYANPFRVWAELTRGLRDRFLVELGGSGVPSLSAGSLLGALAGLITRCDHMGELVADLERRDTAGYEAFLRALEKSDGEHSS